MQPVSLQPRFPADHRFGVLDAWRGVCALLVTIVHIPVLHALQGTQVFMNMQMFVDFFFVLSGFVMSHAYGRSLDGPVKLEGFLIRRFGRIYPLHLAILLGFVALELVKLGVLTLAKMQVDGDPFTGPRSYATLASNLFLMQSFNLHGMTTWNGPAWSISVEFYAYMVFAAAVLFAGMRTALFTALATVALAGLVAFSPNYIFATHDYGFLRCLYGFFVGCVVYQAVMRRGSGRLAGTAAELGSVALLIGFMLLTGQNATSYLAPLVFAVVVYVFAFERGIVSKLLATGPAQALGLWSYSIYMVHMLIFTVEKMVLGLVAKKAILGFAIVQVPTGRLWTFDNLALDTALFTLQIVLTLAISKLTYDWIEDPWRRRFATIARRREQALRAPAEAPSSSDCPAGIVTSLRVARGPGLR
ncbi:MAG TPA: acyltransferase [Beijerinckiaceae bacterium]|nr:acyltransferase [Beijerinckiaceae bacterium]